MKVDPSPDIGHFPPSLTVTVLTSNTSAMIGGRPAPKMWPRTPDLGHINKGLKIKSPGNENFVNNTFKIQGSPKWLTILTKS